jgi:hypothetical protein
MMADVLLLNSQAIIGNHICFYVGMTKYLQHAVWNKILKYSHTEIKQRLVKYGYNLLVVELHSQITYFSRGPAFVIFAAGV